MWLSLLTGAALLIQPATGSVAPTPRTEAQAQLDVCLFSTTRDAACEALLEAEAGLVPDDAFAAGNSMAWADVACAEGQVPAGQSRSDCRRDQRALYRRAEQARQALSSGRAGGIYAEVEAAPPPPVSGVGDSDGLAFSETERRAGRNCEQRSSARRDQDTGDSASSYTFTCSYGSDDPASRERLDELRDRLFDD